MASTSNRATNPIPKRTATQVSWGDNKAWQKYPVKFGDVWRVGNHTLACGDLEAGAAEELVAMTGQPELVYVDPPWGVNLARSFRTVSLIDGQKGRAVDYPGLLKIIVALCKHAPLGGFIEMGRKDVDLLRAIVVAGGLPVTGAWDITYSYGKSPAKMLQAGGTPLENPAVMQGLDDADTPKVAISQKLQPGQRVFDPCLGFGWTSECAQEFEVGSVGIELNPIRLATALKKLARKCGGAPPHKIGDLSCMAGRSLPPG